MEGGRGGGGGIIIPIATLSPPDSNDLHEDGQR